MRILSSISALVLVLGLGLAGIHAEEGGADKAHDGHDHGHAEDGHGKDHAKKKGLPGDKDGDGTLSDEEREAHRQDMAKKAEKLQAENPELFAKIDTDGDGALSAEEWAAHHKAKMDAKAAAKAAAKAEGKPKKEQPAE